MTKIIRVTTAPIALKYLITGQLKFMKENGFDVIAISADGPERTDVMEKEACRHVIVPMARSIAPFKDLGCLLKLISIFKKEKPDIVHSHTPKAGLLAMMAAKAAGVPIRIHTVAGLRFRTTVGMQRKILVAMEKLTFASCTHLWPNSQSIKEIISEMNLVPERKMSIVGKGSSNGIDLKRFDRGSLSEIKLQAIKANIGYETGNIYLLVVGRIVKDKGIEDIAEAFQQLQEVHKNLRLIIIGQFENELDPIDKENKDWLVNNEKVQFVTFTDEIEYYFALSDFLIHPSHREGFPNVLLQAGAMKCPVICSAVEGNIDIIKNKETGLLFEAKKPGSICEAIKYALKNKPLVNKMAESLYKEMFQYYERSKYHRILLEKYKDVLL